MNGFNYTYNLESFQKFFASALRPKLDKLAKKRIMPFDFYKKMLAFDAFQTVCSTLGRFAAYKGKSTKDTYRSLKYLHFFPDFTRVNYKGCFKGKSCGREFDVKSLELVKFTGKSCVNVWNGVLISVPYYTKTAGSVLFQKYDKDADSGNVIKIILKQKEFADIHDKKSLNDGETYLDVIKENYHIVFKSDEDRKVFLNEEFAKNLFVLSKKYLCNISLRILNNTLFIALKDINTRQSFTSNGWFDFSHNFEEEEFMKDIFQQFETVVMVLKALNKP